METTAEQLVRKRREGVTLLLKLLAKLGMPYKEIARKLGVSAPMVTYWAQDKLRMSPEDQTKVYGIFAEAVTQRWPEDDEARQHQLLPLMEQLVATWKEVTALEQALNAEVEDAHLKASIPLVQHTVKSIDEWYAFEKAHNNFLALREAQYELAMTQDAWKKADEVIADVKKVLGEAPAPQPPKPRDRRPHRKAQRRPRLRSRASS